MATYTNAKEYNTYLVNNDIDIDKDNVDNNKFLIDVSTL